MSALGRHLLLECHGCEPAVLTDTHQLEKALRHAALVAGAHVLFAHFHPFGPGQGLTGVLLLRESHISIHSWPEYGYAALDVFMCGKSEPELAVQSLLAALQPQKHAVQVTERGIGLPLDLPQFC